MSVFKILEDEILTLPNGEVFSLNYGEFGRIRGNIAKQGVKTQCRIRLFEMATGKKVGEIMSDLDGKYHFQNLKKIPFFLVAHDPVSQFNAVIQDNVVPK